MDPWVEESAGEIARRAERELEALVGVSSPSGDVRGAEECAAICAALLPEDVDVERPPCSSPGHAPDLLATLHAHVGDLNRVTRIVKLMSLVNSTLEFTEQHLVTNGASELIADVFGERGKHARSAFGVAQIPLGACVEIEMIAEVE